MKYIFKNEKFANNLVSMIDFILLPIIIDISLSEVFTSHIINYCNQSIIDE